MVEAYSYRIAHIGYCYCIFLNDRLFGTIEKGKEGKWHINLDGQNGNFSLRQTGFLRTKIDIQDLDANEGIARIRFPLMAVFLPKVRYTYKDRKRSYWVAKNFFSFHWQWKYRGEIIMETIEDISSSNNTGVITLSSYNDQASLLIITGVYLSLWRKSRLTFGLYRLLKKRDHVNNKTGIKKQAGQVIPFL